MFLENKRLDKSVPIPLYFQLKELIMDEIKSGNYPNDTLIPTEKDLSESFLISRTTVRQAITELVQEGWLYRVKSKGTFISAPKISQDFIQKLETFDEQIIRSGMVPSTEILSLGVLKADKQVSDHLKLSEGYEVICLSRRRFANDEPIVLVQTYVNIEEKELFLQHDFQLESLYKILSRDKATQIFRIQRFVEAAEADSNDAKYLNIKRGKPIQLFNSVGFNVYGKPIEYSIARYRGDRNRFEVNVYADTQNK